eukprot:m.128289 g.128289  ORF g.128289 m.128289 type:complete len:824 (+) comp13622_c0_seq2:532-3003(+)
MRSSVCTSASLFGGSPGNLFDRMSSLIVMLTLLLTVSLGSPSIDRAMEGMVQLFEQFEERFCGEIPGLLNNNELNVYRALRRHTASHDQELSVEEGELVQVLSQRQEAHDGFCTALLRNKVGLVPATDLEVFPSESLHRVAVAVADSSPGSSLKYVAGDLIEIIREPLVGNQVVGRRCGLEGPIEAESIDWLGPSHSGQSRGPPKSETLEHTVARLENIYLVAPPRESHVKTEIIGDMEKGTLELYDSGGVIVLDEGVDEVIPPPVEAAPPPPTKTNDDRLGQCFSPEARSSTTEINIVDLDMISCIGRGGFSHVWKAIRKTPQGEEMVAVKKLILTVDERTERVREALLAEAKVNAGLMHKNIVMFKGVCTVAPDFAIVMEYVDDGTLFDKVKTTLEPTVLTSYARQVASGMAYLHEDAPTTIIHRDLKSLNVLVSTTKICKITDFGMAREHVSTIQMSGAGTAAWMAPEVIRSGTYTKGADVWAYGVVLWEMLTGQVPYEGVEQMAIAYGVGRGKLTLPVPEDCPQVLGGLMNQCWAAKPHDRPSFYQIVSKLRGGGLSNFEAKKRDSLVEQQREWGTSLPADIERRRKEAERKAARLDEREMLLSQQALAQAARERELKERERELRNTEMELKLRHKILLDQQRQPSGHTRKPSWPQKFDSSPESQSEPVSRKLGLSWSTKSRTNKKLSKKDISTPSGFRHVTHMGSGAEVADNDVTTEKVGTLSAVPVQEAAAAVAEARANRQPQQPSSAELPSPPPLPPPRSEPKMFRVTSRDFMVVPPPPVGPDEPSIIPPPVMLGEVNDVLPPPEMFAPPPPQFGD